MRLSLPGTGVSVLFSHLLPALSPRVLPLPTPIHPLDLGEVVTTSMPGPPPPRTFSTITCHTTLIA